MNRRILAWTGLAYMAILLLLNFYAIYTGGEITGIAALMACPALAGFAALTLRAWRTGQRAAGPAAALVILSAAAFVFCLWQGIPALLQNFR